MGSAMSLARFSFVSYRRLSPAGWRGRLMSEAPPLAPVAIPFSFSARYQWAVLVLVP
jgi:hypothetical protein